MKDNQTFKYIQLWYIGIFRTKDKHNVTQAITSPFMYQRNQLYVLTLNRENKSQCLEKLVQFLHVCIEDTKVHYLTN